MTGEKHPFFRLKRPGMELTLGPCAGRALIGITLIIVIAMLLVFRVIDPDHAAKLLNPMALRP